MPPTVRPIQHPSKHWSDKILRSNNEIKNLSLYCLQMYCSVFVCFLKGLVLKSSGGGCKVQLDSKWMFHSCLNPSFDVVPLRLELISFQCCVLEVWNCRRISLLKITLICRPESACVLEIKTMTTSVSTGKNRLEREPVSKALFLSWKHQYQACSLLYFVILFVSLFVF